MFKRWLIIHPFLFALFPVVFLYSYNIDQVAFSQILLPSVIVLAVALILFALLGWLLGDTQRAALIVSVLMILFFSYGRVTGKVGQSHIKFSDNKVIIVWAVIFGCSIFKIIKTRKSLARLTSLANIAAAGMLAASLINIVYHRATDVRPNAAYQNPVNYSNVSDINSSDPNYKPDIYYIILDAYASDHILKKIYKYNNHEFTDYLEKNGFYIANHSQSNYATTFMSLASSLNMEYVDNIVAQMNSESKDRSIFYNMIENSRVTNFLKSKGYKIVHFGSGWEGTNFNRYADVHFNCGWIDEFMMVLIRTTVMDYFLGKQLIEHDARYRILQNFKKLAKIADGIKGPKFVFIHFVCPHPPFIFDADGSKLRKTELEMDGRTWNNHESYIRQLRFVNGKVEKLIDRILSKSKTAPVIILQADHGTASLGRPSPPLEMTAKVKEILEERLRIFNAYYLPGGENPALYSAITPVNTFRIVFNKYFNTNYPLLKDRCYYGEYKHPYILTDVTDVVAYDDTN